MMVDNLWRNSSFSFIAVMTWPSFFSLSVILTLYYHDIPDPIVQAYSKYRRGQKYVLPYQLNKIRSCFCAHRSAACTVHWQRIFQLMLSTRALIGSNPLYLNLIGWASSRKHQFENLLQWILNKIVALDDITGLECHHLIKICRNFSQLARLIL